jgi:hypothetical protein
MNIIRYIVPGGSVTFWHTKVGPVNYDYASLEDYYIDFTAKTHYQGPFDDNGVPMLNYRGSIGLRYNPCAVSQYALGWYQRWMRNSEGTGEPFIRMADWLTQHINVDAEKRGLWYYDFDLDAYGVKAPWISALAQAQGICVLLRAAKVTGNVCYEECARAAYAGMVAPVATGGTRLDSGDDMWLEELVADRPTAILDGYIFALLGVRDYAFYFKDESAENLWEAGIETLLRRLPEYDLGYWSRADLYQQEPPMPASSFYHRLHIAQLQILYSLTSKDVFKDYAERWQRVSCSSVCRCKNFIAKLWFKIRYY